MDDLPLLAPWATSRRSGRRDTRGHTEARLRLAADRSWRSRGACVGAGSAERWFPVRGGTMDQHAIEAKRVCAECPVMASCLVVALLNGERDGIWGGAGGAWLRGLSRPFWTCQHDPLEVCSDGACAWCEAFTAHLARLDEGDWAAGPASVPPPRVFGPGATHARRATHAKGCRCPGCRWSATKGAQDLARRGTDTASFWDGLVGGWPVEDDEVLAAAARLVAAVATSVELGETPVKGAAVTAAMELRDLVDARLGIERTADDERAEDVA